MIYLDVSTLEWLRRYPSLEILEMSCLNCASAIQTLKPFRTKDYVGLASFNCPSCGISHKAYAAIPYSKSEINAWFSSIEADEVCK